jgi:lysozyme
VNDLHKINAHGLRLITSFEGSPRLTARLCEGGAWELSYGVTFYPDGSPVKEHDTVSYDEALDMFRHALTVFEEHVKRLVTVPLNSNQFSALVSLCYNIGPTNMERSSVLRHVNARRFDDAADAFGMWLYATLGKHKQALRGLLRRRYAEAVVFMGYDFEVACSDDAVALVRERPPNDIGTDRVLFKTPFKDVLVVAQRYPLAVTDDELVLTQPEPSPRPIAVEAAQRQPDPARSPAAAGAAPVTIEKPAAASPASGAAVASEVPRASPPTVPAAINPAPPPSPPATVPAVIPAPVGTKAKSPNTVAPADVPYKIDPQAGLKPLEETDRAKGYWWQQTGIGIIRLGSLGVFGTTLQGGAQVVQGDPVLSNLVLTVVVLAGVAVTGYVIKVYGDWRRKRGEKAATQAMY